MFRKKELRYFLVSLLVLTFIFAFDDGRVDLVFIYWLGNFFKIFVFVLIAFGLHVIVQKKYAEWIDCKHKYKLWSIRKFWFDAKTQLKKPIPFGVFLSLILAFYSRGKFFFTALGSVDIAGKKGRVGRSFYHVTKFEVAKCALLGNIANLFLILLLVVLGELFSGFNFKQLININFWIIVWNMIPIPPLDGGKVFFGSRPLYVFGIGFIVLAILLKGIGLLGALGLGGILAFIVLAIYYYKWEY